MEQIKQTARVCKPDLGVAMFQTLEEDLYMGLALCERTGCPFYDASARPTSVRGQAPTVGEGTLPCLEVLSDLRHLYIRVELFYLVENMVLVVVAEVVI